MLTANQIIERGIVYLSDVVKVGESTNDVGESWDYRYGCDMKSVEKKYEGDEE